MTTQKRIERILNKAFKANASAVENEGRELGFAAAVHGRLRVAELADNIKSLHAYLKAKGERFFPYNVAHLLPVLVRNLSEKSVDALIDEFPESALFDNGDYGTTDDPRILAHGRRWVLFGNRDEVTGMIDAVPAMRENAIEMALGELDSDHEGRIAFTARSVNRSFNTLLQRLEEAVHDHDARRIAR